MKINLKIWESAQRMIALRYVSGLDFGHDDTSELYDVLMEDIDPNQIDNFHEMVCRDVDPVNVGDFFVDCDYNVFHVVVCDIDKESIHIRVNGSQYTYMQHIGEGTEFLLNNCKLVKSEDYYAFLDIIWEVRSGLFFNKKDIKRIDFVPTT